jgi:hypothetical protein
MLASALGHAGEGPKRISAELARRKWGGIKISPNGVYRVLKRHGLETAKKLWVPETRSCSCRGPLSFILVNQSTKDIAHQHSPPTSHQEAAVGSRGQGAPC